MVYGLGLVLVVHLMVLQFGMLGMTPSTAGMLVCCKLVACRLKVQSLFRLPPQLKIRTNPLISTRPPPSRSAGDRRAASSPGRAQTESSGGGSVSVGGAPRLSDPPHDFVLPVALLLPGHGLQPRTEPQLCRPSPSGSPLHPAPPAPVSRRATL